jgi:prefoldin subunit 5
MSIDPTNINFNFHEYNDHTGNTMNTVHAKTIAALSRTVNTLRMANDLLQTKLGVAQGTVEFMGTRLNQAKIPLTAHDASVVDIYKAVQVCSSMEQAETIVTNGIASTNQSISDLDSAIRDLVDQVERELRKMEEEDRSGEDWKEGGR